MIKEFSHLSRNKNLETLESEMFDFLIIGGGITGAGIARDAASRGMKVALIEARDFAEGTSSRSSKLIHGGIRYLENMEFGLVFEALSERAKLFEIAPHLVHPLRFAIPIYEGDRVGMFKMGLGMWLYDALSLFRAPELHEKLNPKETLQRLPLLRGDGLKGSYVYSDAYMDDDRLVLETLRSANALGAVCVNYVSAGAAEFENGKIVAVRAKNEKDGSELKIRARHVISSVGPWTDDLGQKFFSDWKKLLRPSKGIHLTFDRARIPLSSAVVMATRNDKRIVFAMPRHEMVIIGTTDTDYKGKIEDAHSEPVDVKYLLGIIDNYFPNAKITEDDIISSYAGVRPLIADNAASESQTSREHYIRTDVDKNITFIAGGKYTTYRLMAEQTVDAALGTFSLEERVRFSRGNTEVALNPKASVENLRRARNYLNIWAKESHLDPADIALLVERHGLEAENLLELVGKGRLNTMWDLEAYHAIHNTMCLSLKDFYLRRVPLFLARKDHGLDLAEGLSKIFAQYLNWSEDDRRKEIGAIHSHIRIELGWKEELRSSP